MFKLIPRTQLELRTLIKQRLRDTANDRWDNSGGVTTETYDAINQVLANWGNRVLVPFVYTLTDGFGSNEREYALPEYVVEPIDVQFQVSGDDYYRDVDAFDVHPTTGGSKVLRLAHYPWDEPARVIYWPANSPVPATVPTLNANISSTTATTCTMTAIPTIGQNGFVKIDAEWMSYQGYSQSTTVTTLNNLSRGLFGSTAATHNSGTSVYWGVVAHRADLFEVLAKEAIQHLHTLFVHNASGNEVDKHQWMMRWLDTEPFWRRYTPMRSPKMRLSRQGIGPLPRNYNNQRYYTNDGGEWE